MEPPVNLFVEGIADVKFLQDYVNHIFGIDLSKDDIIVSEGWTNIHSQKSNGEKIRNKMVSNSDNGGNNLIIFDADSDIATRREEILNWGRLNNLTFELFLFPNDDQPGALEDLLENIIQSKNSPIFDCWNQYEDCLRTKEIEGRTTPLTTPAKKTKIYGYLEALLGITKSEKEKIKEKDRDYKDISHWNLDSEYLYPLKLFLESNFH